MIKTPLFRFCIEIFSFAMIIHTGEALGNFAYVANGADDTVSVINTDNDTVIETIVVGKRPRGIAITPDGLYVYVTNHDEHSVSVIDTEDNTLLITLSKGFNYPAGIEIASDGRYVYVSNNGASTVTVIDTETLTVFKSSVSVVTEIVDTAIISDGTRIYVANAADNDVSVIDADSGKVIGAISVGNNPQGIAITPDLSPPSSVLPPGCFTGKKKLFDPRFKTRFENVLEWTASPSSNIKWYHIYKDRQSIVFFYADRWPLTYVDYCINKKDGHAYGVTAINTDGEESVAKTIFIK